MNRTIKAARYLLWAAAALLMSFTEGRADATHVLAVSQQHKAEVVAEGGEAWCQATLHLGLRLQADSPDANNQGAQVALMNQLKALISSSCRAAVAAEMRVFGAGAAAGVFVADAAGGWVFSPRAPAPAPAVPAAADTTHLLAISKEHKAEVVAEGGDAWCQARLHLGLRLQADSPDANNERAQIALLNQLKGLISSSCPSAVAAEMRISGSGAAAGVFVADAAGGWVFAPAAAAQAPNAAAAAPRDVNYASALLAYLRANPAVLQSAQATTWWAAYRYPQDYRRFANQEFKLQPILENARADLATTMAAGDAQRVTIVAAANLGNYDFQNHRFPVTSSLERVSVSNRIGGNFDALPNSFTLAVGGAEVINSLPMEPDVAQGFVEKRTRNGNVDRQVWIAVTVALDPPGFKDGGWREKTAAATVESATIAADFDGQQPLFSISKDTIAGLRADAAARKEAAAKQLAARQAEQGRLQMAAERGRTIERLKAMPASVRLANWMSAGPVNVSLSLSSVRTARAQALIHNMPVETIMLVQADSSGRDNIATRWPGHLDITVAKDRPAFKSGNWYLVAGSVTASDADGFPPAHLVALNVFACQQDKCADAGDATEIVDRKITAAGSKN